MDWDLGRTDTEIEQELEEEVRVATQRLENFRQDVERRKNASESSKDVGLKS